MRLLLRSGRVRGREWTLDRELTLGRDPDCNVILPDPTAPLVRITEIDQRVMVESFGDRGEILINERPLDRQGPHLLAQGTRLALGGATFEVDLDGTLEVTSELPVPEVNDPPRQEPFHPDRLVVVGEIVEAILRLGNRDSFFEKIVDAVFHTLDVRRAFVMISPGETGEPQRVASRNEEADDDEERDRVSETILGLTLREGRPQLLTDAMHSKDFEGTESVLDFGLRSVLCVPIRIGDQVRGLIYADNRQRESSFTKVDLEYLAMIGKLAGVVLENLEWRERQQMRLEALRARVREGVEFIHSSREMDRVLERIHRFATSDGTVLVTGESGTGKELVARTLHNLSLRKKKPFVPINCAALPENLLESELFGVERGAFTGADRRRIGRFEAAAGGTIFLDEIGDMSRPMQTKLLRVLEGHSFQRVGGNESVPVDVRVIAATNRDLTEAVREGEFRKDLYYRIRVLAIEIPPLRERLQDIPPLARYFLDQASPGPLRLSGKARGALQRYPWPGNVRELKNVMERTAIMTTGSAIDIGDLPVGVARAEGEDAPIRQLEDVLLEHVLAVHERTGGNVKASAEALGIARNTMYRYLREAGRP